MPQGVVIIGVQWGDEGKGKIVDYYTASADVVARFQGGNNAGHTIVVGGEQTILHLIPSGVLHTHATCVIGSGVVVDPEIFLEEIEILRKAGVPNLERRVRLSDRAHLILDYHKHLDAAREARASGTKGAIGTTKRGIGPAYEDRASRRGLRVADLFHPELFNEKLQANIEEKNFLLTQMYHQPGVSKGDFVKKYSEIAQRLKPFVEDTAALLHRYTEEGKKILFEGAQGVLLDIDYGTYPYVTSSHTLPSQAALGCGSRIPKDTLFLGILKAYSTRVGEGPFPTHLTDDVGRRLRDVGKEYGATTGRERKCGWLDLVSANYSLRISGIRHLAITKSDVLSGMDELKVCTAYEIDGERVTTIPADTNRLAEGRVKPVYTTLPGWKEPLSGVRRADGFPKAFREYLSFIEHHLSAKILLVSVGAGRDAVIELNRAF